MFPTEAHCHISGVQVGTVESVVCSHSRRALREARRSDATFQHDAELKQWLSDSFELVRSVGLEPESAREVHWRVLVLNRTDTGSIQT